LVGAQGRPTTASLQDSCQYQTDSVLQAVFSAPPLHDNRCQVPQSRGETVDGILNDATALDNLIRGCWSFEPSPLELSRIASGFEFCALVVCATSCTRYFSNCAAGDSLFDLHSYGCHSAVGRQAMGMCKWDPCRREPICRIHSSNLPV
jgi:hypothetical protein